MPGTGKRQMTRLMDKIAADNPGVTFRQQGSNHTRVYTPDGQLAGILPLHLRTEGLSKNLRAQFRRAGITI